MRRSAPDDPLTEVALACGFVRHFAGKLVTALEVGDWLDERAELREYCGRTGLEATPQRLDLVTDVAVVLGEHYRANGAGWETPESLDEVPREVLAAGLERYGWRRAYLEKPVAE